MSTLPHPETIVLVPRAALPPSLSFVPEPVALPGCDLRKGGQDRPGKVSPVVSNMSQSLLQASILALKKAWDVLKITICPSVIRPTLQPSSSSPEWEVFVLCG